MSVTRDFAVSFVSLKQKSDDVRSCSGWVEVKNVLDDIQSGEKHELCFFVKTHPFDMRFDRFNNQFSVFGSSCRDEFSDNTTTISGVDHLSEDILTPK